MRTRSLLFLVALLFAVPSAASAQVAPDKVLPTFKVVDGLQLELFAAEPMLINPTSMDIDHKGRVWVCEAVNYRNKMHKKPLNRPEGDRIVILEDTDGDGKADTSTVFYQGPELYGPLGIAVAKDPTGPGYKVFVCQSPDILVFTDSKGEGKADGPPKKFLSGFGGFDHDHGVHGILIGPDMKLYFSVGDTGVHGLQSSDGKGRKWESNDSDCQAGTIWRCDLDGKNLELIAHNFRNEYEPCVDSFGTVFVSDNDDDGLQQTRICYVMPGGNYGYHMKPKKVSHWNEEIPGVVPKILRTYFGSPTGMCVYEGTLLPRKYQGQLLHTDAGPRHLRCYHLTPKGAGYDVEREDMVTNDKDSWFRPSDVCVAPDGSVFVADWYDPGVGGHGMGDWTRGRIYRVTPKGHKGYKVPEVKLDSPEGVRTALASPALSVRYMAMARLDGMKAQEVFDCLKPLLTTDTRGFAVARAFWQIGRLARRKDKNWEDKEGSTGSAAKDDVNLEVVPFRVSKDFSGQTVADSRLITPQWCAENYSSAMQREILLSLRDAEPAKAKPYIVELAKKYDGQDRFYLEAIGIAVGHWDKARRDIILKDFDKEFPEWNDKVADLVWELRPPSMMPTLGKKLTDPKLSASSRGRIIDILAASEDTSAGKAMLDVLQSDVPAEVRDKVIDNLKLFLPGKWNGLRPSKELSTSIDKLLARSETAPTGLALVAAAERVDFVPKIGELVSMKGAPDAVKAAAVKALGALPSADAIRILTGMLPQAKADTLGVAIVQALGQQLDERGKNNTAVQPASDTLHALVLDKEKNALVLREAAVSALAGSRNGTQWLLELHDKKQLPDDLTKSAGIVLRNSQFPDLRNKAMLAFPPPGKINPKNLPSIAVLATRKGDAGRGKALLAASVKGETQCLKCHTIRGTGGSIGPDLSMIGKKASRENLIESILYPNKAIADQYVNWNVETKKGLTITGLIVEEAPDHILLRDANGKDTRIDTKDIDSRTKNPNSLMPNDIVVYLSEDELTDVVEYLLTLKTPSMTLDSWLIAGPFENGPDRAGLEKAFPPEKEIDLKATYDGKTGKVSWRTVKAGAGNYFDLQAFHGAASPQSVSYLYRQIESPADQEATILLGSDDGCKLWVNDQLVHTSNATRAAAPEQDVVKVKLTKGKNKVLLKIDNGDGPHGFYFSVESPEELKR
ncbi:MAG TPA: PVC-type heme-binding CxxCH protein [Gemmataceae bacterium]|nr:PVC-type heme-binding CxxCH protein [Gemmataceae bacterium]